MWILIVKHIKCKYFDVHIQIQGTATQHHTIAEGKTK